MTRTLTSGMQTEVAASLGDAVRLLELQLASGTLRYANSTRDVTWNGVTWSAIGGNFVYSPTVESGDVVGATTDVSLAAVEGTLAQTIANASFVGRVVNIYVAKMDQTTRLVVVDPMPVFSGLMSGGWQITEDRAESSGTITATVKCVSRLVALTEHRGIQCNLVSHQAHYPTDTFFTQTPQQQTQPVIWGKSYVRLV